MTRAGRKNSDISGAYDDFASVLATEHQAGLPAALFILVSRYTLAKVMPPFWFLFRGTPASRGQLICLALEERDETLQVHPKGARADAEQVLPGQVPPFKLLPERRRRQSEEVTRILERREAVESRERLLRSVFLSPNQG